MTLLLLTLFGNILINVLCGLFSSTKKYWFIVKNNPVTVGTNRAFFISILTYIKSTEEAHTFHTCTKKKIPSQFHIISGTRWSLYFCFVFNCSVTNYESETTASIMLTEYRENRMEHDLWTKAIQDLPIRPDVNVSRFNTPLIYLAFL